MAQSLSLDPARIIATVDTLQRRIAERFPASGLAAVCADLATLARTTAAEAQRLARPNLWFRGAVAAILAIGLGTQLFFARTLTFAAPQADAVSVLQGLEAAVNLLLLMGAGIWSLLTLEERFRRRHMLTALHALRSIAHVIDMHQLTKDPTILLGNYHRRTAASTAQAMSEFELTRYLEYCAEMQALTGKLAALHAENMRDPVVIEAVNDIETLTTNLGRKIWQKITIIKQLVDQAGA
jgi:hypothetical protein